MSSSKILKADKEPDVDGFRTLEWWAVLQAEEVHTARTAQGCAEIEAGNEWWERLLASGFDAGKPAIVASTGVGMSTRSDAGE